MSAAVPNLGGAALQRVTDALEAKGSRHAPGGNWQCPAHGDDNPSLSVKETEDGVLVFCHARCTLADVVSALDLEMRDLFNKPSDQSSVVATPKGATPISRKIVARYEYTDRHGEILSTKTRFEPKDFRWDNGNPGVLYNLPEVVEADDVWLNEGEKAADALAKILPDSHAATVTPTTKWEDSFTECLRGKRVNIIVDRDEPGKKRALVAHEALVSAGVEYELLFPKVTDDKSDAYDHIEYGFGLNDFIRIDRADLGRAEISQRDADFNPYPLQRFGGLKPHLSTNYLIKGVLDRGSMGVIYGQSGCSKSFCAIDLAMAIASGMKWKGNTVRRGRVVYVAAEGAQGINNRLYAIQQHLAIGNIDAIEFYLVPSVVKLTEDSPDVERFIRTILDAIGSDGVDLIIIDTLSRSIAGKNENSPQDMSAAVEAADQLRQGLGAAVLIVHHSGKVEAAGARGHTSLKAALDTEFEVKQLGDMFAMRVTKQREHESGTTWFHRLEQIEIGVDDEGDPVTTCIVRPVERDDAPQGGGERPLNVNEQRTHSAILGVLARSDDSEGEPLEAAPRADLYAWVETHFKIPRDRRRGVVRKGLEGLKSRGLVAVEKDNVFLLEDAL